MTYLPKRRLVGEREGERWMEEMKLSLRMCNLFTANLYYIRTRMAKSCLTLRKSMSLENELDSSSRFCNSGFTNAADLNKREQTIDKGNCFTS